MKFIELTTVDDSEKILLNVADVVLLRNREPGFDQSGSVLYTKGKWGSGKKIILTVKETYETVKEMLS